MYNAHRKTKEKYQLITSIGLISYMKTRIGLKPEEYGENEIFRKEKLKNA